MPSWYSQAAPVLCFMYTLQNVSSHFPSAPQRSPMAQSESTTHPNWPRVHRWFSLWSKIKRGQGLDWGIVNLWQYRVQQWSLLMYLVAWSGYWSRGKCQVLRQLPWEPQALGTTSPVTQALLSPRHGPDPISHLASFRQMYWQNPCKQRVQTIMG